MWYLFQRLSLIVVFVFGGVIEIGANQVLNQSSKKMNHPKVALAYFAGGCFWCMEDAFDRHEGVIEVLSGYMGGWVENPTYEQVSYTDTGHAEVIQITYDPEKISYKQLLRIFWMNIDPTQKDGQFCDQGRQYRSVVFYGNEEEKKLTEQSMEQVRAKIKSETIFYTEIIPAKVFYRAEDYHQDYYKKNPLRYKYYKYSCGREKRLKKVWGDFYQKK